MIFFRQKCLFFKKLYINLQRTKEFIRESLCKRRSFMIKKNSCFIDNCVFKERGSRETLPFSFSKNQKSLDFIEALLS